LITKNKPGAVKKYAMPGRELKLTNLAFFKMPVSQLPQFGSQVHLKGKFAPIDFITGHFFGFMV